MKARRFPGVRCSTLNTECRSLLCLMIMPGRSWVAGIDMLLTVSSKDCVRWDRQTAGIHGFTGVGIKSLILHRVEDHWKQSTLARHYRGRTSRPPVACNVDDLMSPSSSSTTDHVVRSRSANSFRSASDLAPSALAQAFSIEGQSSQ